MLYFLHGDFQKVSKKKNDLVSAMLSKKPDAVTVKISSENWSLDKLQEAIGGQSLFTHKYIVTLTNLIEQAEVAEVILGYLKQIAESENIFIWSEKKVDAKSLKKIEKVATKVQNFDLKPAPKNQLNVFALGEAVGERNRKKAWLLYLGLKEEVPLEELYGIMWWQVKAMILASQSDSAKDAGLKPFVYSKSKNLSKNFSSHDLDCLANKLIDLYHGSRLQSQSLEYNLEKFMLSL